LRNFRSIFGKQDLNGEEADFTLSRKNKATHLIEVKTSDDSPAPFLVA